MIVQCPQCQKKYRLEDRHGDKSEVLINCPNCGMKFKFHAEDLKSEEKAPKAAEAPAGEKEFKKRDDKKILIADDSPFFRSMVGDILNEQGYHTVFAADGEEALNMLHAESPDLLILDLHLPKISGFNVIKEIRHGQVKSNVPILVLSSVYTQTSHVMTLDTLGANDFIDKKFKPEYLIKRVRKLLGE